MQIKPRNDKFTLLTAHVRDKDCSNYQFTPLCSKYLTLECCKKHSKVGTFEGLFESSTFVCALTTSTKTDGHPGWGNFTMFEGRRK